MSNPMTRRDFLKATMLAGAGLASASILNACAAPATPAPAPTTAPAAPTVPAVVKTPGDQFSWQRFKGEKI